MQLGDVDYATMVSRLEEKMERTDIAAALGVDEKTIDDIASGYVPDDKLGSRLRALATSAKAGDACSTKVSRRMLILFVACDAIFFIVLAVVLILIR